MDVTLFWWVIYTIFAQGGVHPRLWAPCPSQLSPTLVSISFCLCTEWNVLLIILTILFLLSLFSRLTTNGQTLTRWFKCRSDVNTEPEGLHLDSRNEVVPARTPHDTCYENFEAVVTATNDQICSVQIKARDTTSALAPLLIALALLLIIIINFI